MEKNEFTEEATKSKSIPQFSARITESLKQTIDAIASETGKSKAVLLDEFVRIYQTKIADEEFADMDLSRYDNLSNPLKESIHGAFKHILNAVNGNLSTLKQSAILVEEEKISLAEREEVYKAEIEFVKSACTRDMLALRSERDESEQEMNSQIEFLKNKSIDLEAKNIGLNREFGNVNKIAEQVRVVTTENKELRGVIREMGATQKSIKNALDDEIKSLSGELMDVKQTIFREKLENDSNNKVIEALKERILAEKKERATELDELKEEFLITTCGLSDTKNKYNKALGKLEVLEKSEIK